MSDIIRVDSPCTVWSSPRYALFSTLDTDLLSAPWKKSGSIVKPNWLGAIYGSVTSPMFTCLTGTCILPVPNSTGAKDTKSDCESQKLYRFVAICINVWPSVTGMLYSTSFK